MTFSSVHGSIANSTRLFIDWAGLGVLMGSWLGLFEHWLPPVITTVATFFGLVWYLIQIWESKTFQAHLLHVRARRHVRNSKPPAHRDHHKRHPKDDIQ